MKHDEIVDILLREILSPGCIGVCNYQWTALWLGILWRLPGFGSVNPLRSALLSLGVKCRLKSSVSNRCSAWFEEEAALHLWIWIPFRIVDLEQRIPRLRLHSSAFLVVRSSCDYSSANMTLFVDYLMDNLVAFRTKPQSFKVASATRQTRDCAKCVSASVTSACYRDIWVLGWGTLLENPVPAWHWCLWHR